MIYYGPALKDNRLRAPGVCVLDRPAEDYAKFVGKSGVGFKPKYAIYLMQKVDRGDEDPRRQMFNDISDAGMYLINTNNGRQILRSMLDSQR